MNVFAKTESNEQFSGNGTMLMSRDACASDLAGGSQGIEFPREIGDDGHFSNVSCDFRQPAQDWYELALQAELVVKPVRSSWGEDEEDADEEIPVEDGDEEEQDPFEDFDEDDFDDDFDDDFEEELEDEYEIEPADDGMVTEVEEIDPEMIGEDGAEPEIEEDIQ